MNKVQRNLENLKKKKNFVNMNKVQTWDPEVLICETPPTTLWNP